MNSSPGCHPEQTDLLTREDGVHGNGCAAAHVEIGIWMEAQVRDGGGDRLTVSDLFPLPGYY